MGRSNAREVRMDMAPDITELIAWGVILHNRNCRRPRGLEAFSRSRANMKTKLLKRKREVAWSLFTQRKNSMGRTPLRNLLLVGQFLHGKLLARSTIDLRQLMEVLEFGGGRFLSQDLGGEWIIQGGG